MGIAGMGRVGTRVAALAGAFGIRLLGYDPALPAEQIRRRERRDGAEAAPPDNPLLALEQLLMALEGKRPTMVINPEIWET